MKRFFFIFLCLFGLSLQAEIREIQNIELIKPEIEGPKTLVLLDMDDTLTDSTISLGTGAWRKYIRQKIAEYEKDNGKYQVETDLHDLLTHFVASHVPVKSVEIATPKFVKELQEKGVAVFVFTARGKSKWYDTDSPYVNVLTNQQLRCAGFDFSLTEIPEGLSLKDTSYYEKGVIYTSPLKKGDFLLKILKSSNYKPSKIVFVDDKRDQVESVEQAAKELNIPFIGYWYRRADFEHKNFNPLIATIQLKELLETGEVIEDEAASKIAEKMEIKDPDLFFFDEILSKLPVL